MPADELRGPDGDRRRAARRLPGAGLPSARLWASVPHYVAAAPNPKAALALVRKLESLVGVSVDAAELETAAADYERQVSLAVQADPDVQAFVERLEQAAAEEERAAPSPRRAALRRRHRARVPALPAPARPRRILTPSGDAPQSGPSTFEAGLDE